MTFRNVQRSVRILVPYSLYSALYHVHYIGNRERFRTQLLVPENGNQNQPRKSLVIRVIGRALSITHSPVNGTCDWNVRQPRATNRFRAKWSRPQERFFLFQIRLSGVSKRVASEHCQYSRDSKLAPVWSNL